MPGKVIRMHWNEDDECDEDESDGE